MSHWQITVPETDAERAAYFELRWQILRKPQGEPPGSERDEWEDSASHAAATTDKGRIVGVGRLHSPQPMVGQIRYMAVHPDFERQGVASALLNHLESQAAAQNLEVIRLNARNSAVGFYQKRGYTNKSEAPTAMNIIHYRMEKRLPRPDFTLR